MFLSQRVTQAEYFDPRVRTRARKSGFNDSISDLIPFDAPAATSETSVARRATGGFCFVQIYKSPELGKIEPRARSPQGPATAPTRFRNERFRAATLTTRRGSSSESHTASRAAGDRRL